MTAGRKEVHCPYCDSTETSKRRLSEKVFAISVLLLGFPILFLSRRFHCFECGKDFKAKSLKRSEF